MKVRFQADNDLRKAIVRGVVRAESQIDFRSAQAARFDGVPDSEVLALSAETGRILVSHDFQTTPGHLQAIHPKTCQSRDRKERKDDEIENEKTPKTTMATELQTKTNRENALKSTGPKTPEGTQRSARNATRHGLLARSVVLEAKSSTASPSSSTPSKPSSNPATASKPPWSKTWP